MFAQHTCRLYVEASLQVLPDNHIRGCILKEPLRLILLITALFIINVKMGCKELK